MHIFLYGPSGSGKSTVGQALAQSLNLPFVDLDAEIETVIERSIAQFMTERGELAFRDAETAMLRRAVEGDEKVVALGGGALLRDKNRALAESVGQVILLEADLPMLVRRLMRDENKRPLLAGELKGKLSALLERRREHYSSFPLQVDASQTPEEVVWDIQRLIGRYHLRKMGEPYDVVVQEGGIDHLGEMFKARNLNGPVLVISDTNIAPHYAGRVLDSLTYSGIQSQPTGYPGGRKT